MEYYLQCVLRLKLDGMSIIKRHADAKVIVALEKYKKNVEWTNQSIHFFLFLD